MWLFFFVFLFVIVFAALLFSNNSEHLQIFSVRCYFLFFLNQLPQCELFSCQIILAKWASIMLLSISFSTLFMIIYTATIIISRYQIHLKYQQINFNYLGPKYVIENLLDKDNSCWLLDEESDSSCILSVKNPGCLGSGSSISLLNIKTTNDMFGLSSGCGCTHNNPIWIALNTSDGLHDSKISLTISSTSFSSLYSLQAYAKIGHHLLVFV